MDIEAIKQLKHAYFRCVDTANLEELGTLFHEDVKVRFKGGGYEWNLNGRKEYVNNIGMAFSKEAVGQHNAHHPEIQILSTPRRLASGTWQTICGYSITTSLTTGTALYWDRYLKVDGKWLIKDTATSASTRSITHWKSAPI